MAEFPVQKVNKTLVSVKKKNPVKWLRLLEIFIIWMCPLKYVRGAQEKGKGEKCLLLLHQIKRFRNLGVCITSQATVVHKEDSYIRTGNPRDIILNS